MTTATNDGDDGDDAVERRRSAPTTRPTTARPRRTWRATSPACATRETSPRTPWRGGAAVPRSTIANLESGAGNPSLVVLVKVAHALGVPIDELLASPRAKVRRWPAAEVAIRVKGRGVTIRDTRPRAGARRDDGGDGLRARRGDGAGRRTCPERASSSPASTAAST